MSGPDNQIQTSSSQLDLVNSVLRERRVDAEIDKRQKRGNFMGASFIEPALTMATGIAAEVGGGLSGIVTEAMGGDGAQMVESFRRQTYQPQTESGEKGLENLGKVAEYLVDKVRVPLSGIGGILELVTGQGTQQAADTVGRVRNDGAGVTFGDRVFEETGNPLLATIASVLPEGSAEVIGAGNAPRATRAAARGVNRAANTARNTATDLARIQTPGRQRIAQQIAEGSTDNNTARFVLDNPRTIEGEVVGRSAGGGGSALPPTGARSQPSTSSLPVERPRVRRNRAVDAAIDSGFEEGFFASVREATPATRRRMLEMVDNRQRGFENYRFSQTNDPTRIVGDSAMNRYNFVLDKNREAAKMLDDAAKQLNGKFVDVRPVVDNFLRDLETRIGVTIGDDLTPIFRNSDIQGLSGPERIISGLIQRMRDIDNLDAAAIHRLKRYIDENVSYGRSNTAEGLTGTTHSVVKSLRHELDSLLDGNFPEYDRINTTYSETIQALDDIDRAVGSSIDLLDVGADAALGTKLRTLMSNNVGRQRLANSLERLEEVGRNYGGEFDDDLILLSGLANEMDTVFGPARRTSFMGDISRATRNIPTSGRDVLGRVAERAIESLSGDQRMRALNNLREAISSFE